MFCVVLKGNSVRSVAAGIRNGKFHNDFDGSVGLLMICRDVVKCLGDAMIVASNKALPESSSKYFICVAVFSDDDDAIVHQFSKQVQNKCGKQKMLISIQ